MSIRFAPAAGSPHHLSAVILAPGAAHGQRLRAANDNCASAAAAAFDPMLVEALRHFGRHGLNAAAAAHRKAEAALNAGSRTGFEYWLGITRNFDPRLARKAEHSALPLAD